MKRIFVVTLMFVICALFSQCRKPVFPDFEGGYQEQTISFSTIDGQKGQFENDPITKIVYHWNEAKDKIYVYATTNPYQSDGTTDFSSNSYFCGVLGEIIITNPGTNTQALFSGGVKIPNGTKALRFIHYGENFNVPTTGEQKGVASVSFANQTGKLDDVSKNLIAYCDKEYSGKSYKNCGLEMAFALMKLSFDNFSSSSSIKLKTQVMTQVNVSGGGSISYATKGEMTFNINDNKTNYFTVLTPSKVTEYVFKDDTKECYYQTSEIKSDAFYANEGNAIVLAAATNWTATVTTIPVRAIHSTCASGGGNVTGSGVDKQGVIWANVTQIGDNELTLTNCAYYGGGQYVHNENATKNGTDNKFTGFMNCMTSGGFYCYRAFVKNSDGLVRYGNTITFVVPSTEPFPTDDYVNFGTPNLNWAKYNLGYAPNLSESTTEEKEAKYYGDYYQWADNAACYSKKTDGTTFYVDCNWQSYRYVKNSSSTASDFTKYTVADAELEDIDDCVSQTLGSEWRLPTIEEWKLLKDNNTYEWLTAGNNSVNVTLFTAPTNGFLFIKGKNSSMDKSKYMFLPAAGRIDEDGLGDPGRRCRYWSSVLSTATQAFEIRNAASSTTLRTDAASSRCNGSSVRPVFAPQSSSN